ncbi:putative MMS1_N domain-containing protein [Pseudomonas chlororaphis]
MMGHDNRLALIGLIQLLGQPRLGQLVSADQIIGTDATIVTISPDLFEICHPLSRHVASGNLIASAREIRPTHRAKHPDASQLQYLVFQNMHVRRSDIPHFLQRAIEMTAVQLVITHDVDDVAVKRLTGPLDTASFFVDVSSQYHQVNA